MSVEQKKREGKGKGEIARKGKALRGSSRRGGRFAALVSNSSSSCLPESIQASSALWLRGQNLFDQLLYSSTLAFMYNLCDSRDICYCVVLQPIFERDSQLYASICICGKRSKTEKERWWSGTVHGGTGLQTLENGKERFGRTSYYGRQAFCHWSEPCDRVVVIPALAPLARTPSSCFWPPELFLLFSQQGTFRACCYRHTQHTQRSSWAPRSFGPGTGKDANLLGAYHTTPPTDGSMLRLRRFFCTL